MKRERRTNVEFNCFANTWAVSRVGTNDKVECLKLPGPVMSFE